MGHQVGNLPSNQSGKKFYVLYLQDFCTLDICFN